MTKVERKRTAQVTPQERREHRTWRARIVGVIAPRPRPQGIVTPVSIDFSGGKERGQKLRRNGAPPLNPRAAAKFRKIHDARRERNEARRRAREATR